MKQNPILTIAQNMVKKASYDEILRNGYSKEQAKLALEKFTVGKQEKIEIYRILRFLDEISVRIRKGEVIYTSSVYDEIVRTTKSDRIIAMLEQVLDYAPKQLDSILGLAIPFDLNSRYRKMSSKVYEYITSLGSVSGDLTRTAVEDLSKMIDPETGVFHDMILVDTSNGPFILEAFITRKNRIRILTRFGMATHVIPYSTEDLDTPQESGTHELKDLIEIVKDKRKMGEIGTTLLPSYDPLSFYVNIYLAEKTNHLVPGKESNYDKKKVVEICRAENKPYDPKDKSVRYEYIDVSEERWKQHTEFKNAVHRKMEGDRKWYKSHWWRKAHYMKAGKDKHLAFVEATICHRSCGKIEDEDLQVVQVLR